MKKKISGKYLKDIRIDLSKVSYVGNVSGKVNMATSAKTYQFTVVVDSYPLIISHHLEEEVNDIRTSIINEWWTIT